MTAMPYKATAEDYPSQQFQPLPAGKYPAVILEESLHTNKAGNGQYFKLKWQIVEGPFTSRIIFSQHNVILPNPEAERIGRGEMQSFATAVGITDLEDASLLVGKPMIANVTLREDKTGKYEPQNSVNRASVYDGGSDLGCVPFDNPTPSYVQRNQTSYSNGQRHQNQNGVGGAGEPRGEALATNAAMGAVQQQRTGVPGRMNTRSNPFAE